MTVKKKIKIKPKVPRNALARRVCEWINVIHDGNVSKAALDLGCSYDALLRQAYGTSTKPILAVVQALSTKTGQSVDWWLTGKSVAR